MRPLLAAIRASATPGAVPVPASAPSATPEMIRDIAPAVDYSPYPGWLIVAATILAFLLLVAFVWGLWRWWSRRPAPPPPTPRAVALAELARLRGEVRVLDPYAFSIAVSHVLRAFVEGQFHIPALEQTSPEFLAAIAKNGAFSDDERQLLGAFLERCDAIKFGQAGGDAEVNEALLASAESFVQGGHL